MKYKIRTSLITAIKPLNEKEEKEKFLLSKSSNPNFIYIKPNYNINKAIEKIKIKSERVYGIFEKPLLLKNEEKILTHEIVRSVNTPKFTELSVKLYGTPSIELIQQSLQKLKELKIENENKNLPCDLLFDKINNGLRKYGIRNWRVFKTKSKTFTVNPTHHAIFVPERKDSIIEIKGLYLHEFQTHVLRACNGLNQPQSKLFSNGTYKYEETEEGLALYLLELNGLLSNESLIKIHSSVITIDSLLKGESFRKTYEMLRDYGFSEQLAWDRTLRTYRGGGFTKDYVYLSGLKKVKQFHEEGNNLKQLFMGKISINDLQWVKPLLRQGILKNPRYVPNCKLSV